MGWMEGQRTGDLPWPSHLMTRDKLFHTPEFLSVMQSICVSVLQGRERRVSVFLLSGGS